MENESIHSYINFHRSRNEPCGSNQATDVIRKNQPPDSLAKIYSLIVLKTKIVISFRSLSLTTITLKAGRCIDFVTELVNFHDTLAKLFKCHSSVFIFSFHYMEKKSFK